MISCEVRGGDSIVRLICHGKERVDAGILKGLGEISRAVAKKAREYAPRSPTRAQVTATLKVKRRSTAQCTPGGLEKSIRSEVRDVGGTMSAIVFVAANAPAGAYAKRIHDEKGITWWKRGPGTRAKGDKADEKFIERAIADSRKYFKVIMENEMRKELAKA